MGSIISVLLALNAALSFLYKIRYMCASAGGGGALKMFDNNVFGLNGLVHKYSWLVAT